MLYHLTASRAAADLSVSSDTANAAILAEGKRRLIDVRGWFDGVLVVGVEGPVWRHTRLSQQHVRVVNYLTPVREKTGPVRLVDMVEGRSKAMCKTRLATRTQSWRNGVDVVAMERFTGFKTATAEELRDAVTVMGPFYVVRLARDALEECRRRGQRHALRSQGQSDDPIYKTRCTLHTGAGLLPEKQQTRLEALFDNEQNAEVKAT